MHIFQRGASAQLSLVVRDSAHGEKVNADALPTISTMVVNGLGVDPALHASAPTLAQAQDDTPANVTGVYLLSFDSSQFAKGDVIMFEVMAVVNGVNICTFRDCTIVDNPDERPVIE